jgi:hypothetical protein
MDITAGDKPVEVWLYADDRRTVTYVTSVLPFSTYCTKLFRIVTIDPDKGNVFVEWGN